MNETEAAVAIVHARQPEDSVLLMRRAERAGDPWSGHWSFPGGRRDPGDLDLLHTALRELEEECGLRLRRADMERELPLRYARRRTGPYVPVTPFIFRAPAELAVVPDMQEAVEALWAPLGMISDSERHRLLPIPGMPRELRYPAIHLGAAPLWGFTYRLLADWLGLGPAGAAQDAGFQAAEAVLEFLRQCGCETSAGWAQANGGGGASKVASVRGPIPVAAVLDRFSGPGEHVIALGCLEVRPDIIRVLGTDFEEYAIMAISA